MSTFNSSNPDIMSIVTTSIFFVFLVAGCVASWHAALRWQNRTRDADTKDPKDQEIRELTAAVNVARKEVETLTKSSGGQGSEIHGLQQELQKARNALANTQEQFNATKETLNKEYEEQEDRIEANAQLRRDLEAANGRLGEFAMRGELLEEKGSGLLAGMDDVVDDDEKEVFTIRHEHKVLKEQVDKLTGNLQEQTGDAERWKKHCGVMTQTNKTLKGQLEELAGSKERIDALQINLQEKVQHLDKTQSELESAQATNTELLSDNEQLLRKANELKVVSGNLQTLQDEHEKLQTRTADYAELQAEREQLRTDKDNMQIRLDALSQIESDNEALLSKVKNIRKESATELLELQQKTQKLQTQVEAIEKIQRENIALTTQARESNQRLQEYENQVTQLREALRELKTTDSVQESSNDGLKIKTDELENKLQEMHKLQAEFNELKITAAGQGTENDGLKAQVSELNDQLHALQKQQEEVSELNTTPSAQDNGNDNENENDELKARISELESSLEAMGQLREELAELSQVQEESSRLQAQTRQLSDTLKEQAWALSETQDENETLNARLNELNGIREEHEAAKPKLNESTFIQRENAELRNQLNKLATSQDATDQLQSRVEELTEEHSTTAAEATRLSEELDLEQQINQDLSGQLKELSTELEKSRVQISAFDNVKPEKKLTDSDQEQADTTDNTDSLPVLDVITADQSLNEHDDLQLIKGVGAKLEEKLNMLGIVNFKGLLDLSDEDYDRARELIPSIEKRITNGGWIDQARELHQAKYNEAI
jgi:predicted flap endonuclease-1-like 5' DNA nuclease/peptidoglycan hydrolase CwlO-like protein